MCYLEHLTLVSDKSVKVELERHKLPHSFTSWVHVRQWFSSSNSFPPLEGRLFDCFFGLYQLTYWRPRPKGSWWNQFSRVTSDSLKHTRTCQSCGSSFTYHFIVSVEYKDPMSLDKLTCLENDTYPVIICIYLIIIFNRVSFSMSSLSNLGWSEEQWYH